MKEHPKCWLLWSRDREKKQSHDSIMTMRLTAEVNGL